MNEADITAFVNGLYDAAGFTTGRERIAERVPGLLEARAAGPRLWMGLALETLVEHLRNDAQPPCAAAVVQSDHACGFVDQDPCEHATWFIDRVAEEARRTPEPWVAMIVPDVRPAGVSLGTYNPLNSDAPALVTRLRWYVEMRSVGVAGAYEGVASLRDDEAFAGRAVHPRDAGIFRQVLRGHPARRRHAIRRQPAE